jgi:hypothetical protein
MNFHNAPPPRTQVKKPGDTFPVTPQYIARRIERVRSSRRTAIKALVETSCGNASRVKEPHRSNFVARGHKIMTSCRDKGPFSLPRGGIDPCEMEALTWILSN